MPSTLPCICTERVASTTSLSSSFPMTSDQRWNDRPLLHLPLAFPWIMFFFQVVISSSDMAKELKNATMVYAYFVEHRESLTYARHWFEGDLFNGLSTFLQRKEILGIPAVWLAFPYEYFGQPISWLADSLLPFLTISFVEFPIFHMSTTFASFVNHWA